MRPCLVGLLALAFGPKSQKPNQRDCFWRQLFQKQLFFRSIFLKAGLILLLAFGFLLFKIGGIKSYSIVVLREIKIQCIFYTCLTKQLSVFLQLTAHSPQQLLHSSQPTTAFSHSHSSTKQGLRLGFWLWLLAPKAKSPTKGAVFGGCFFRSSCFSVVHF